MTKELITLSFGSYASFVSAHYWNLQDEVAGYSSREDWSEYAACIDHEVLFAQAGEGRNGSVVYRPRTVLFDVVGSTGGVSFSGDGPAASTASSASMSTWKGACEVHRSAPVARSAFLETLEEHEGLDWEGLDEEEAARQQAVLEAAARQLDASTAGTSGGSSGAGVAGRAWSGAARHWTDYCKVLFPPRSICLLPGVWTNAYEHSLAGGWGDTADLLGARGGGGAGYGGGGAASGLLEEAADRIRYLAEACDSLAGFQVLADDLTGFGAVTASVLEEVAEEFSGRPLVFFSLRRPGQGYGIAGAEDGAPVSTAQVAAWARDELSQALALSHMRQFASLYVPLAVPAGRTALPYLRYDASRPFHTSAVLASAVDTALLPVRLTGARSPLGEALSTSDLHSLVRLLRPGGRDCPNLAALHLALPCPSLPADIQQLQRQLDERLRPPHDSAVTAPTSTAAAASHSAGAGSLSAAATAAGGSGAGVPSGQALHGRTAQLMLGELASLTPGITGRDDFSGRGASRAESYCLRGARTDAGPASTSAAIQSLDLLLLRQPHRMCVRHRCAAPMPLTIPLPFPGIFTSAVLTHGDVAPPTAGTAGSSPGPERGGAATGGAPGTVAAKPGPAEVLATGQVVHSVPVLSRLQATSEFRGWVREARERWGRAAGGTAGRGMLEAWGLGRDDAEEVGTQLRELASSYDDDLE